MDFSRLQQLARTALAGAASLDFDELSVTCVNTRSYKIRVALGSVCRENVFREESGFVIRGAWQTRTGAVRCQATNADELRARLSELRVQLSKGSPNKEWVRAQLFPGSLTWDATASAFDDVYAPERLYGAIESAVAPVRATGLRVSGYVEAQEHSSHVFTQSGFDVFTRGQAAAGKFTVDSASTLESGSGEFSVLSSAPGSLENALARCLAEAKWTCSLGRDPQDVKAGDWTVVFSPKAVRSLVESTFGYGFFDRRKIDEGRTFLSKAKNELNFPKGFSLRQAPQIQTPQVAFAEPPFNERQVLSKPLALIESGRIQDTQLSPYWASQLGEAEGYTVGSGVPVVCAADVASTFEVAPAVQDLIASTERGLFVAGLWYLRMVSEMEGVITGMTRDGVYEIRNGKILHAVKNLRWHENPFQAFSRVTGMSADPEIFGMPRIAGGYGLTATAALRTENFHFSSVTQF